MKGRNYTIIMNLLLVFVIIQTSCKPNASSLSVSAYYVSSSEGDDANNGLSPLSPWASLEKVNSKRLKPGEKIFFKSGDKWSGQLEIKGKGRIDSLIIIDKYGLGPKPRIDGWGANRYTLLLKNASYCTVRNLEITNQGAERKARRTGVLIQAINSGECHAITLDSLEIHHVNGSLVKKEGGGSGIFWENGGDSIKSRFVDLKILNSHLHHCGRNGITSSGYASRDKWYPSLKIVIRNNLLEQIPGDGIVPIGTDGALIEHNTMRDCPDILSHEEAAAGIWPWSADNTTIQFNEVSEHRAKWDGQGFDSDYNCKNTIIQYNYSHDNYGGFLLVCNDGNSLGGNYNHGTLNSIIRYNISINDGIRPYPTEREGWFSPVMHITGPVLNSEIHHNIFIMDNKASKSIDNTFIKMDNWGDKWPISTAIYNNIFYAQQESKFHFQDDVSTKFYNNTMSEIIDTDSYPIGTNVRKETLINGDDIRKDFQTNNKNKALFHKWVKALEAIK